MSDTEEQHLPAIPSDLEKWATKWSGQLTTALGGTGTVRPGRYGVLLKPSTTEEDIELIIDRSVSHQHKTAYQDCTMKFSIADMVLELAERREATPRMIIEELNLVERTGREATTLATWVRTAGAIPYEERHSTLSWAHFQSASMFKVPEDPLAKRGFITGRAQVLEDAAQDPVGRGKRWIEGRMRDLQSASGTRRSKTDMKALFEYGVKLYYLDNNLSAQGEEALGYGIGGIANAITEFEGCMINMGVIDPVKMEHPGRMPVQEEFEEEPPARGGNVVEAEVVE
jgi:hypothetical protein